MGFSLKQEWNMSGEYLGPEVGVVACIVATDEVADIGVAVAPIAVIVSV